MKFNWTNKNFLILIIFFFSHSNVVAAENLSFKKNSIHSENTFDWNKITQLALASDLDIQAAIKNEELYKRRYFSSLGAWAPKVTAYGQKLDERLSLSGINTDTKQTAYGAQASINIFSGFATQSTVSVASTDWNLAKIDRMLAEVDLRKTIRLSTGKILVLKRQIEFLKSTLKQRQLFLQMLKIKYQEGTEALWSLQQSETEVDYLTLEIQKRQEQVLTEENYLKSKMNLEQEFELMPFKYSTSDEIKKNAPQLPPILQKSELQLSRADLEKSVDQSVFYPKIDFVYKYEKLKKDPQDWADNRGWNITLSWELFSGFSSYNTELAHASKVKTLEYNLATSRKNYEINNEKNEKSYDLLRKILAAKEKQLGVANTRVNTVESQYRSGRRTFSDWESSQNALFSIQKDIIQIESDLISSLADFESTLGIGLSNEK